MVLHTPDADLEVPATGKSKADVGPARVRRAFVWLWLGDL
jgi:hypothetical protein